MSQTLHFDVRRGCTCRRPMAWSHHPLDTLIRPLRHVARIAYGAIRQSRERRAWALLALDARPIDDIGLLRDKASCANANLIWRSYASRHLK